MKTKLNRQFKKYRDFVLDLLIPRFCLGCGEEGSYLCSKCARSVLLVVEQICPKCERLSELGQYHLKCRKNIALKGIIVAAYYQEGPLKEIIHYFKYNAILEVKDFLSRILADAYKRCHCEHLRSNPACRGEPAGVAIHRSPRRFAFRDDNFIVTFAPLHPRRQAFRGYNQAEILARGAAKRLKLPLCDILRKIKSTKRQVGLVGSKRRQNLVGAFEVHKVYKVHGIEKSIRGNFLRNYKVKSLKGKRILIVDDITTTGSTLNECAKVLKEAGAKEVWGLVVARG